VVHRIVGGKGSVPLDKFGVLITALYGDNDLTPELKQLHLDTIMQPYFKYHLETRAAQQALEKAGQGYYLVRFSGRVPGSIVLCIADAGRVHHHLTTLQEFRQVWEQNRVCSRVQCSMRDSIRTDPKHQPACSCD
jgi:hypothetical protein